MKRPRLHQADRNGLAMIEFAMVVPIMVMVVMGIIEFARAFEVSTILTTAAREGTRLAMLSNIGNEDLSANAKVAQDVTRFVAATGMNVEELQVVIVDATVDLNPPDIVLEDADRDTYFMVRITVPFKSVSYTSPIFLKDANLRGEMIGRHE